MSGRARAVLAWFAVIGYMALIYYLSAQSDPLPTLTQSVSDKILHGCEYAGLATLWVVALRCSGATPVAAAVGAVVAASAYGATDELHQWFVPGRSSDVADWVADTLAAALVGAGSLVAGRLRKR